MLAQARPQRNHKTLAVARFDRSTPGLSLSIPTTGGPGARAAMTTFGVGWGLGSAYEASRREVRMERERERVRGASSLFMAPPAWRGTDTTISLSPSSPAGRHLPAQARRGAPVNDGDDERRRSIGMCGEA